MHHRTALLQYAAFPGHVDLPSVPVKSTHVEQHRLVLAVHVYPVGHIPPTHAKSIKMNTFVKKFYY